SQVASPFGDLSHTTFTTGIDRFLKFLTSRSTI
ncbi:hypothetical protein A2U01_0077838, partial [Trifolium medium]|nr:hypothetical protein [Trifolium medium]